jgi:hypothetical protein
MCSFEALSALVYMPRWFTPTCKPRGPTETPAPLIPRFRWTPGTMRMERRKRRLISIRSHLASGICGVGVSLEQTIGLLAALLTKSHQTLSFCPRHASRCLPAFFAAAHLFFISQRQPLPPLVAPVPQCRCPQTLVRPEPRGWARHINPMRGHPAFLLQWVPR